MTDPEAGPREAPPEAPEDSRTPTPGPSPESPSQSQSQSPPSQRPADHGGWIALSLGLAGLPLTFLFWPIGLVLGVAFDAAAILVGIRALRRARGQRGTAPGARGGLVLGSVGLALGVVLGSFTAVFWSEFSTYQQCLQGAITIEARDQCDTQLRESVAERLGVPAERLRPAMRVAHDIT
ncbi:MAG: hypothetical protein GEV03_01390 [Streptosporangiales bacterium]|nr:hypothetical protein [Streptosporangiales bacterium]